MQDWTVITKHGLQKKEHKKIKAYRKSVYKEATAKRCLSILDLKPFGSLVKGKHSIGREFQSPAVQGNKTVDIDILVTSRNGDRKIKQSIRITNRWTVQMNIYQSNKYRKDLSWLHFNHEPRIHEKQQAKDQKSCIFVFVAYLTILSSN